MQQVVPVHAFVLKGLTGYVTFYYGCLETLKLWTPVVKGGRYSKHPHTHTHTNQKLQPTSHGDRSRAGQTVRGFGGHGCETHGQRGGCGLISQDWPS